MSWHGWHILHSDSYLYFQSLEDSPHYKGRRSAATQISCCRYELCFFFHFQAEIENGIGSCRSQNVATILLLLLFFFSAQGTKAATRRIAATLSDTSPKWLQKWLNAFATLRLRNKSNTQREDAEDEEEELCRLKTEETADCRLEKEGTDRQRAAKRFWGTRTQNVANFWLARIEHTNILKFSTLRKWKSISFQSIVYFFILFHISSDKTKRFNILTFYSLAPITISSTQNMLLQSIIIYI